MKKVLLMQSRLTPSRAERELREFQRALEGEAHVERISLIDDTPSWDQPADLLAGYDAVMIGGSGDFHLHGGVANDDPAYREAWRILEKIRPFVSYALDHSFPVLGVCFGHQLIAEVLGGNVTSDPIQKKTGTYMVELTEEGKNDALFRTFPQRFMAQYAHKDSVTSLPKGASVLALGETCNFSALRYGQQMYTVQFHPELTQQDMIESGYLMPHYLPEGARPEDLFHPSIEAPKIISRFVENSQFRQV